MLQKVYVQLTAMLILACSAMAGNGDVGSVGDAAPANVVSTSQLIEQYSPQWNSLSITDLCAVFSSPKVVWGKSRLTCIQRPYGIVEVRGYTSYGTLSVFANATDKTVYEDFGADQIHQYRNNLQQGFRIQLEWVHTQGYYKVDAYVTSKGQTLRVGYYDYLQ
jgi:hypothetical protein